MTLNAQDINKGLTQLGAQLLPDSADGAQITITTPATAVAKYTDVTLIATQMPAVSGDDSIGAAVREVKEETGLDVLPENGEFLFTRTRDNIILDVWLFRQDFDISDVKLQENETIDAKYATPDEIRVMINNGEFITYHYIDDLFQKASHTTAPHVTFRFAERNDCALILRFIRALAEY